VCVFTRVRLELVVEPRQPRFRIWWCLLFVLVVGCRGCKQDQTKNAEKEEEERKKKQRLVADRTATIPSETAIIASFVKPGHWYQANTRLTANLQDESLSANLSIVDATGKSLPIFPGSAPVEFQRNVSLARGQQKNVSLTFFQPDVVPNKEQSQMDLITAANQSTKPQIKLSYSLRGVGTPIYQEQSPVTLLNGYQYSVVTLCKDPARYSFLRAMDCMSWSSEAKLPDEKVIPHRVFDLKEDEIATQFPNRLYAMTSMSHVIINDGSPSVLSPEQQQSLLDWLHFGGTIVVNGIDAIGSTSTSFLKNVLPLVNTQTVDWGPEDTDTLNRRWVVPRLPKKETILFETKRAFPKVTGDLAEGAQWIDSLEGLVAEKFIGQGRVVITTFPMNDLAFLRWPSYSSLIHNAVFRMPSRTVTQDREDRLAHDTVYAKEFFGSELNPLHSTRLRLWARDLDLTTASLVTTKDGERVINRIEKSSSLAKKTSLGSWNSQSIVMQNARASLQESSGITVPKIKTIIMLLVGYLAVLVPINWLVFRLMGRLELAWVAAPFIAIIGAFVVARSVQLDVGFSRSQNSYGFLECHTSYPRAVLSNYMALYTSLSTNYQVVFEGDNGIVTPIPQPSESNTKRRASVSAYEFSYAGDEGAGLRKTPVMSNTTGMLQSEEIVNLGGDINAVFSNELDSVTFTSQSDVPLYDVGIFGVTPDGYFIKGWLGSPEKGVAVKCDLSREGSQRWFEQWERDPSLAKPDLTGSYGSWTSARLENDLFLGKLLMEVTESYPLSRGEFVAIGWTNEPMSQLKVTPETTQTRHKTMVMVHLRPADLPGVKPDEVLFPMLKNEETAVLLDENEVPSSPTPR
jgi:hypothetical protein